MGSINDIVSVKLLNWAQAQARALERTYLLGHTKWNQVNQMNLMKWIIDNSLPLLLLLPLFVETELMMRWLGDSFQIIYRVVGNVGKLWVIRASVDAFDVDGWQQIMNLCQNIWILTLMDVVDRSNDDAFCSRFCLS